jgi:putative transcriptional regulator
LPTALPASILGAMDEPRFLTGKLLLAMPGMGDPRFERAVIAMCAHDENGAVGIGIGHKRAGLRLRGLLVQLGIDPGEAPDRAVHHGGPVEPGRGFVLHSTDWGGQDSLHVAGLSGELFAMTGTLDVLKAIAEGEGPSQWLVALGYAGWGEGQLDEEMTRHGWFAADGHASILFDVPTDERWAASFKTAGVDPRLLVGQTGAA